MQPLPSRKPNRLPNYDYTSCGAYFITLCLSERKYLLRCLPCSVTENNPLPPLSVYGGIVQEELTILNSIYTHVV